MIIGVDGPSGSGVDPISPPFTLEGSGGHLINQQVRLQGDTYYTITVVFELDAYVIVVLVDAETGEDISPSLLNESSGTTLAWNNFKPPKTGLYRFNIYNIHTPWTLTVTERDAEAPA